MGLFLAAAFLLVVYYLFNFYRNVQRYPKGPLPLPLVGNLLTYDWRRAHLYLSEQSKIYGSVFTLWLPRPYVCIMEFDELKEAFVTKGEDFVGRSRIFPDTVFQNIKNGGIIFSDGDEWREQRRTALHIMRDFGMGKNLMEQQVINSITKTLNYMDSLDTKEIDLRWPLQIMVQNIICNTLFGYVYPLEDCQRLKDYANLLSKQLEEIKQSKFFFIAQNFDWIEKIPILGHWAVGRFHDNIRPLRKLLLEDIERALEGYDPHHEPECFVQAYRQRMEKNSSLTQDQLINVCMDFYIAGMETTTTTLRWAMLILADNQESQDKMRKEILDVIGHNRLPSMADKPLLPYTNAVMNEILRVANIVPVNVLHKTTCSTTVGGFKVPEDTVVLGQIAHVLSNSPVFTEPQKFQPERFLMEDGMTANKATLEHMVAFSLGKRQCAGEALARMELFLGLISIVQKYKIEPMDGQRIDMEPIFSQILTPKQQSLKLSLVSQ